MLLISTKNLRAKTSNIANRVSSCTTSSTINVASSSEDDMLTVEEQPVDEMDEGEMDERYLQAHYSPISSVGSAEKDAMAEFDLPRQPAEYKWLGLISTATDANANPTASYIYKQKFKKVPVSRRNGRGRRGDQRDHGDLGNHVEHGDHGDHGEQHDDYGAHYDRKSAKRLSDTNYQMQLMMDWWRVHPRFEIAQRSQLLQKMAEVDNVGDDIVPGLLMFADNLDVEMNKQSGHVVNRFNRKLQLLNEEFESSKRALDYERESELKCLRADTFKKLQQKRKDLANEIYTYRFKDIQPKSQPQPQPRKQLKPRVSKKLRQKPLAKKVFNSDYIEADLHELRRGIADYDALKLIMMLGKLNGNKPLVFT